MQVEIDAGKYHLQLDADGLPYVLKRYKQNEAGNRWYWGIVWANWHKGLPTGARMQVMNALGWQWNREGAGQAPHWEQH